MVERSSDELIARYFMLLLGVYAALFLSIFIMGNDARTVLVPVLHVFIGGFFGLKLMQLNRWDLFLTYATYFSVLTGLMGAALLFIMPNVGTGGVWGLALKSGLLVSSYFITFVVGCYFGKWGVWIKFKTKREELPEIEFEELPFEKNEKLVNIKKSGFSGIPSSRDSSKKNDDGVQYTGFAR